MTIKINNNLEKKYLHIVIFQRYGDEIGANNSVIFHSDSEILMISEYNKAFLLYFPNLKGLIMYEDYYIKSHIVLLNK